MERAKVHQVLDTLLDLPQTLVGEAVPAEAWRHFRAARREVLLGLRAAVESALKRLDREGEAAAGARSIPVEGE